MRLGLALDLGSKAESLPAKLDRYQPLLRSAESLGFHTVWAGETYPVGPDHAPWFHASSSLIALTALASRTELALGAGVLLAPAYHPLRLAYDAAMVDQLSGGRLTLGLGLGSAAMCERFGVPVGRRVDHLLDCVEELRRARGRGAPEAGAAVRAAAQDRPWLFLAGGVAASARRAAEVADGYYVGSSSYSLPRIGRLVARYREEANVKGRAGGPVLANRLTLVEETTGRAARLGERYVGAALADYARAGSIGAADGDRSAAHLFARHGADTTLVGPPDVVAERLRGYHAAGVTHLAVRVAPEGTPTEVALRSLKLFGEHVMPSCSDILDLIHR